MARDRFLIRTRVINVTNRTTGKRERFRVVVNVPHRAHGSGAVAEKSENVMDAAQKIFEGLVKSGRIPPPGKKDE